MTTGHENGLYKLRSATQLAATGPAGGFGGAREDILRWSTTQDAPASLVDHTAVESVRGGVRSHLKHPSNQRGVLPGPFGAEERSRSVMR